MFTANIVERFSHPNKIEAQERRGGVYPKLESHTGLTAGVVQCPAPSQASCGGRRPTAGRAGEGVGPDKLGTALIWLPPSLKYA